MTDAQAFCVLATHFLRLSESAAELLVRRNNVHVLVTDQPLTPQQYNRRTRWSDHAVGVALLFNFYHGLELVLKGCLSLYGPVPVTHKLTSLLKQFEARAPNSPLAITLAKHIRHLSLSSPLGGFLAENSISIDAWYEALKYPRSNTGQTFSHIKLKYGGQQTVAFWKSVKVGAALARKQAVQHVRKVSGA